MQLAPIILNYQGVASRADFDEYYEGLRLLLVRGVLRKEDALARMHQAVTYLLYRQDWMERRTWARTRREWPEDDKD